MARRVKKVFSPGTFIPFPQRLVAIIQLCLAFSLMIWYMTQPFMGEYFNLRSRMLLYEYVMGTSDALKTQVAQETQKGRFEKLSEDERLFVLQDYQSLQKYAARPFIQKIEDGMRVLLLKIPAFEQAWIFFAVVIAILLLLKIEGAQQAAWLLPLLALAYAYDNYLTGNLPQTPSDQLLFPSEQVIVQEYLTEPLSSHLLEQKKQLEKGWHRYLLKNWSTKQEQVLEEAEFNFTVARLQLLHQEPLVTSLNSFHERVNLFLILLYLAWNTLFAVVVNRPRKQVLHLYSGGIA